MLERLTRNKIPQRLCLLEVSKLSKSQVTKVETFWSRSFAFPNKPVVESTSESTEETKETESEVSGSTTSSSSFDEKSSEEVVPAVEGQPPCRFKNRQTSCKHASVEDEWVKNWVFMISTGQIFKSMSTITVTN